MLRDVPMWFKICAVICLVVGISSLVFTWKECGARTLMLGDGAVFAAATGMCD
jgi:hypothetical protein